MNGAVMWRTPEPVLHDWAARYGLRGYSFAELLPHFQRVEDLLNVTTDVAPGANLDSEAIRSGCDTLGWRFTPGPRAVIGCRNTNLCATGCPTGAKQSTALSYLPRATRAGARIIARCRAVRANHSGSRITSVVAELRENGKTRRIVFRPDFVVFSGGAIQTPSLLRRSGVFSGRNFEFHLNLPVVAVFSGPIHAARGTIYTGQVREFADQGILMSASNWQPHYLATHLSHFGRDTVESAMERADYTGLFVALVRPQSCGRITHLPASDPLLSYRLQVSDFDLMKAACRNLGRLLFASGAISIYLPISGTQAVSNPSELEAFLESSRPDDFHMLTTHVMSSCPMREKGALRPSVVGSDGRLHNCRNALVCDASVLPSNIGESPQETIMAVAHEIIRRRLEAG